MKPVVKRTLLNCLEISILLLLSPLIFLGYAAGDIFWTLLLYIILFFVISSYFQELRLKEKRREQEESEHDDNS